MLRKLPAVALILLVSSGCAAMNTFQTPTVLEPGKAMFSPGIVVGTRGPTQDAALPDRGLIPLGRGLQVNGRIGVLPHLELGTQVVGLSAVGFDAKVGFQHHSFLIAGNVGLGIGGNEASGLTGYESQSTRTHFGGVFFGYKGGYVGAKVIDYNHQRDVPEEATQNYERVIPSVAVGYVGSGRGTAKPIMELNLYHFPDEVVFTLGLGVHILIGK